MNNKVDLLRDNHENGRLGRQKLGGGGRRAVGGSRGAVVKSSFGICGLAVKSIDELSSC